MRRLFNCSICGYVTEADAAPTTCPKCHQSDKFVALSDEEAQLIYQADRTNDIHAEIIALCGKIIQLSTEGIAENLDPLCVAAFSDDLSDAWVIKQRSRAEIAGHLKNRKW